MRAVVWLPAGEVEPVPSGVQPSIYHGTEQLAHSHTSELLTVGYWGPGYETEIWECDPEAIRAGGDSIGAPVDLTYRGRFQLHQGTVLHYRAFRDLHVQFPPSAYSISVNLILDPAPGTAGRDQYLVDLSNSTLADLTNQANNAQLQLIELAQALPDPRFVQPLEAIAEMHPAHRVREYARTAAARIVETCPP